MLLESVRIFESQQGKRQRLVSIQGLGEFRASPRVAAPRRVDLLKPPKNSVSSLCLIRMETLSVSSPTDMSGDDLEVPRSGQWPVDPQDDVPISDKRIWIDGCFDFSHHGEKSHPASMSRNCGVDNPL